MRYAENAWHEPAWLSGRKAQVCNKCGMMWQCGNLNTCLLPSSIARFFSASSFWALNDLQMSSSLLEKCFDIGLVCFFCVIRNNEPQSRPCDMLGIDTTHLAGPLLCSSVYSVERRHVLQRHVRASQRRGKAPQNCPQHAQRRGKAPQNLRRPIRAPGCRLG